MADNTQVIGTTIDNRVKFVEVVNNNLIVDHKLTDAAIASIPTSAIVFIKSENAIYHNGKYYGFTDAERAIIDTNTGILLQKINDRVKTVKVNGDESNNLISIIDGGTSNPIEVDLKLNGMTIPISSSDNTLIKNYIDATVSAAQTAAQNKGVELIVKSNNNTVTTTSGTQLSFDITGNNIRVGSTISGNTVVATVINAGSTLAQGLEKLDKELYKASTDISSNSGSITSLKGIVHTIDSGSTANLSSKKSQTLGHTASSTIALNSTNIVIGGNSLTGTGITTTATDSTIHTALENLYDRIGKMSDVDSTTITTLNQLRGELINGGTGTANITNSFLDKIALLIDGFTGVTVSDATTTGGKNLSLATAVQNMIASTINATVDNFKTIKFISSTNSSLASSFSQGLTTSTLNSTGTVNIVAKDLVIGENVATNSTNVISSSDTISTALGKLQKSIKDVSDNSTTGVGSIHNFDTITITSNTSAVSTSITSDGNNKSGTFNIRAKELILGASSNAGVTLLATTDTIVAALNKLNSETQNKLDNKLNSGIKVNDKSITTTNTSITLGGGDIKATNYSATTSTANIAATDTVNGALSKLELKATTAISNLGTVNSAIATLQTKVNNLESDTHMYWYTI